MLITKAISNLYNGVSQQAPSVRLPSQAELQTNGFSSIVEGLKKRPPTEHIKQLFAGNAGKAKVHMIQRDSFEQYVVVIRNGVVQVWDILGNAKTVHLPNGVGYLSTPSPEEDIQCVTVADHTFILNKRVTATMTGGSTSTLPTVEYRNTVLSNPSASFNYEFFLTVGGATYSEVLWSVPDWYQSGSGWVRGYGGARTLNEVVVRLRNKIAQGWPTFDVTVPTSTTIRIAARAAGISTPAVTFAVRQRVGTQTIIPGTHTGLFNADTVVSPDTYSYTVTLSGNYDAYITTGTFTAPAAAAIKGSKQLFSDLPTTGNVTGDIWILQGDPNNQFTGYYVKWNGGAWVETVQPGINNAPRPSTLPHLLVRNADGTFTFKQAGWNERLVGTLATSPNPSFINRKISGVFFYRNRLGFLTDENVVFSRAGDFFNFFRSSATVVLDDDPIDVSVSHTKVSLLKHAIPFNKNLLLFSEHTQFILTAEDALTPKNVAIHQTTEFECSAKVTPVAAGTNCYFITEDTGWAAVREYYVQDMQSINDADDVTAHVPTYIPAGVDYLEASTNEDILLLTTKGKPRSLFVYKMYWKGDEKAQSSWSEWTFSGDVLSVTLQGSMAYLVVQHTDGVYLERMTIQEGAKDPGLPVLCHLDRKVRLLGYYHAESDTTSWVLPYPAPTVQLVVDGAFGQNQGQLLQITRPNTTRLQANGNWTQMGDSSTGYAIVGVPYEFRYRFSPVYPKDRENNPLARAKVKIRNWSVFYDKTAHFKVEVSTVGRDTGRYTFTGRRIGEAGNILGAIAVSSGKFSFPVMTDAATVTIDIINDSYLPCFLQSAEYEGFMIQRSRS